MREDRDRRTPYYAMLHYRLGIEAFTVTTLRTHKKVQGEEVGNGLIKFVSALHYTFLRVESTRRALVRMFKPANLGVNIYPANA